jgi:hypothetical protein
MLQNNHEHLSFNFCVMHNFWIKMLLLDIQILNRTEGSFKNASKNKGEGGVHFI